MVGLQRLGKINQFLGVVCDDAIFLGAGVSYRLLL